MHKNKVKNKRFFLIILNFYLENEEISIFGKIQNDVLVYTFEFIHTLAFYRIFSLAW